MKSITAAITLLALLFSVATAAGVGCNNANDLQMFKDEKDIFHTKLDECATKCMGTAQCSTACIKKELKLTPDCAACFGDDSACMASHCMAQCLKSHTSQECLDCHTQHCEDPLVACAQVDPKVIPQ